MGMPRYQCSQMMIFWAQQETGLSKKQAWQMILHRPLDHIVLLPS
jgi:hypothetical protein